MLAVLNLLYIGNPNTSALASNEDADEMQHSATIYQDLHCFLRLKQPSGKKCKLIQNILLVNPQSAKWTLHSKAKIRNRYNQIPHLTQDTISESTKNTNINITYKRVMRPVASSTMRALSSARCTDVRLNTLRIKKGTNQRALGELSHY